MKTSPPQAAMHMHPMVQAVSGVILIGIVLIYEVLLFNICFYPKSNPYEISTYPTNPAHWGEMQCLTVADLNGDGRQDVLVSIGGGIDVFMNDGRGQFTKTFTLNPGAGLDYYELNWFVVADFTGDGKPDILAHCGAFLHSFRLTGEPSCDLIFAGNGDGTFQSKPIALKLPFEPGFFHPGDFNGDGKTDLFVIVDALDGSTRIGVLPGNGDGTFQPILVCPMILGTVNSRVVADFNGDGKLDVAFTHEIEAAPALPQALVPQPPAVVADRLPPPRAKEFRVKPGTCVVLGNGDGTFIPAAAPIHPFHGHRLVQADFNHDGKPDLQLGDLGYEKELSTLPGRDDGTFGPPQLSDSFTTSLCVSADMDGDGIPDLCTGATDYGSNNVQVRPGNGDGTFRKGWTLKLDVGNFCRSTETWTWTWSWPFLKKETTTSRIFNTIYSHAIDREYNKPDPGVAADFNGDGKMDLALLYIEEDRLRVILNMDGRTITLGAAGNLAPLVAMPLLLLGAVAIWIFAHGHGRGKEAAEAGQAREGDARPTPFDKGD